jgi:glycosyltransferase involved in cell wall biosynthesis
MRGVVIIPARNEEASLGNVLDDLKRQALGLDVVVVNDGSTDATGRLAASRGAVVVTHLVNLGYSRTLLTGMRYALERGYDFCLTLDADGQHDPRFLKTLVDRALLPDRPDLVVGSRFMGQSAYRAPWPRRLGMWIFSHLTGVVAGNRVSDTTCGLRFWSRRAMEEALTAEFGLDSEMIIYAMRRGLAVAEVPVEIRERKSGESMYNLVTSLAYPFRTLLAVFVLTHRASKARRS